MAKILNIHILGIAGTMTTPLAIALQQLGHHLTGSDQEKIYPPISTILETAKIPLNITKIDNSIDLAIIGSSYASFTRCQQEFELIKKLHIPYISATEYLAKNLIKKNSILVAGSYGKTTITALLSWIFKQCNFETSHFFGGLSATDNFPSLNFSSSDWSLTEADESIKGLDTKAKFLYYPVKYLILTSVNWEHKESYSTANQNLAAFQQLISNIPPNGALIYNQNDQNLIKLIPFCQGAVIPFTSKTNFSTQLPGLYNQQNIQAAYTLCLHLGLNENQILPAIASFTGVKRRLELISNTPNLKVFDDFAQSPPRVKSAIDSLKYSYPHHKIIVYFEPHASFLEHQQSLVGFKDSFQKADIVLLGKIKYSGKLDKNLRSTAQKWQLEVGPKLHYLPLDQDLTNFFLQHTSPNDLIVLFSSGGQNGLQNLQSIVKSLNKVYNSL